MIRVYSGIPSGQKPALFGCKAHDARHRTARQHGLFAGIDSLQHGLTLAVGV